MGRDVQDARPGELLRGALGGGGAGDDGGVGEDFLQRLGLGGGAGEAGEFGGAEVDGAGAVLGPRVRGDDNIFLGPRLRGDDTVLLGPRLRGDDNILLGPRLRGDDTVLLGQIKRVVSLRASCL